MIRRFFLHPFTVFCLLLMVLSLSCREEKENKQVVKSYGRPNIIMIVVDDMRWDEFSAMGHPFLSTPHIDRLAKEGVLFENAYQAVPLCSPNRASILTGQYPSMHGIIDNVARDRASHQLKLFAPVLQKAGYETAHIGKWHMGNDPTPRPGYDYWSCLPGQGRSENPELFEKDTLHTVEGYVTDILTDRAVSFIQKKREKPFFLYIGHKAIHPDAKQLNSGAIDLTSKSRFIPAPRHAGRYKDAVFERRKNVFTDYSHLDTQTVTGLALLKKNSTSIKSEFGAILDHFTSEETIRDRSEMLLAVDEGLGRIFQILEDMQILDNTFLLFTSDNGYFYGEHGLSLERRLPYEESIRAPLLIRYPPLAEKGSRKKEFVLSIDYAPTVLDLAGAPVGSHIQGKSILSLFEGKTADWRTSFMMEYYSFENPMPWLIDTDYKVLRIERYKYIHWFKHNGQNELYDLQNDPYELDNLTRQKNKQDLVNDMENKLAKEVARSFGLEIH